MLRCSERLKWESVHRHVTEESCSPSQCDCKVLPCLLRDGVNAVPRHNRERTYLADRKANPDRQCPAKR